MAKGEIISTETKTRIVQVCKEHPDWQIKQIQEEVARQLKGKGKAPGVSAVQKFIARLRNLELDRPFSLGTLVKYPIPPEVLPVVLRVWAKRLEEAKPDKDGFSFQMTFTIRDALWVARLAKLFDDPEAIWGFAFWYSVRERAYEAIDEDMDTSDLDTELLKNFKPTPTESKRKRKGVNHERAYSAKG
jgi:hypothetical protein